MVKPPSKDEYAESVARDLLEVRAHCVALCCWVASPRGGVFGAVVAAGLRPAPLDVCSLRTCAAAAGHGLLQVLPAAVCDVPWHGT